MTSLAVIALEVVLAFVEALNLSVTSLVVPLVVDMALAAEVKKGVASLAGTPEADLVQNEGPWTVVVQSRACCCYCYYPD